MSFRVRVADVVFWYVWAETQAMTWRIAEDSGVREAA
jgi:hypothetical protein